VLDDDLVGADAVHADEASVLAGRERALGVQDGKLLGDHAHVPARLVGLARVTHGVDLGRRHTLVALAEGAALAGLCLLGLQVEVVRAHTALGRDDDPAIKDRVFAEF
jgi:hypothetical protein